MKTKKAILVGAVILFGAGALSNLQWSMDGYGLLNSSLSQQVLALASDDKSGDDKTGDDKKGFKEKKYINVTRKKTVTNTVTTTLSGNILIGKGGTSVTHTTKTEYIEFLNACSGEGTLQNCTSSWDESPML